MQTFSTRRAGAVIAANCLIFCLLIGRVAYLQTFGRQGTFTKADNQQHQRVTLPARRGNAYDRNGLLMAGTVQHQTLFIDPHFMHEVFDADGKSQIEKDDAMMKLASLVEKDPLDLERLLADRTDARFVKVADDIDDYRIAEIQKLNMPGVGFVPSNVRVYPMGGLAAHVLGDTGKDGHGLEGMELRFDKMLAGKDGYERVLKDARRRPLFVAADDYLPPQHGQHLVLTIDSNLQMFAEQALAEACIKNRAKHGEVVVMDPYTGEVLALANYPSFDPQNIDDVKPENRRNNALVSPYEPGSTIKPFILGPALMWHQTRPTEVWPIPGITWHTPYGRTITDVHGYGPLATWDVLVKSSNIGMSMLGERLGNPLLHKALVSFNFGSQTGIELPGEDPGRVNPLVKWQKTSTESVAQGYELMVTPIQICRAFCAYANGGRLVRPTLIRGVLDADGHLVTRNEPVSLSDLPRVIDPQTAAQMRRIMADVVVRGTATSGRSDTWNFFGKTGTAHISEGKRGYSQTRFNSSFIGGAPYENPRLVVAFIIHEPDKSIAHYGGTVSAPAAKEFFEKALAYLQVPPSPDLAPPGPGIANVLVHFDIKAYKRKEPKVRTAGVTD
jgi:cell division protein FtsI (penicillin-binding protein 3)